MTLMLRFEPTASSDIDRDPTFSGSAVSFGGSATLDGGTLRVQIDLAFDEFRTQGNEYGLGCTKTDVVVAVEAARVTDWARFQNTGVNHTLGSKSTKSITGEFKPTVAGEVGGKKLEVTLGSLSRTAGTDTSDEATYAFPEQQITARHINDMRAVKWTIDMPRGTMAFRNWIVDAFNFWSFWDSESARGGRVRVRYDMNAFDRNGHRVGRVKSFFMKMIMAEEDQAVWSGIGGREIERRFGFGS